MGEVRTLEQLQDALDSEISWRIKEIKAFQIASKGPGPTKRHFIRAGLSLVYAHWEGFIKGSSELYLGYVDSRGLLYRDLKTCFSVFGLKAQLNSLGESRRAAQNIASLEFLLNSLEERANLKLSSAINTESNLTSKVFANIANSLDIDLNAYSTKFNLIDNSLVRRRNAIAHGEYLDIGGKEFGELTDEVLQMMRAYKTDLQNAASLEAYKRQGQGH